MQLHSMIVDDWFTDFEAVRKWADGATYDNVTNPVDGVVYPGICADIPEQIRTELHFKLQAVLGGRVDINTLFTRLSTKGVHVPHQAHNDASMGEFSLMIYLNRPQHCDGGTELIEHHDIGCESGPRDEHDLVVLQWDANKEHAWITLSRCPMKSNRAFIFDARLMHRALPIGGFGQDAQDGRLVLTAFFDLPA